MLNLIFFSSLLILFPQKTKFTWYHKMWSLVLACLLSEMYMHNSTWNYKSMNIVFSNDYISSLLIFLTFFISLMMLMASQNTIKITKNQEKKFMFTLFLLNLILVLAFLVSDTILFYIMFEASLIPTLILILSWGYQPERMQAGMYMMMYTVTASLPLLFIIVIMNLKTDSSQMLMMAMIQTSLPCSQTWMLNIITIFTFLAFLVKLPMFTLHLWLPKAHVEAPVAGSMILAAVLLKLGGYGILRFMEYLKFHQNKILMIIFSLALWGGMLTSVICFRQIDLKALIAYSSIGHMSLMLAGAFSNSSWGWTGALLLMISHGFCSSALFALANSTYEKSHTRSLMLTKGILLLSPSLALWWFLFSIMNMASPPSINLLGEIMIFPSAIFSSSYFMLPVGLMSFLSALYSMYLFTSIHHGGNSKFSKPFLPIKTSLFNLFFLHWIPANMLILKTQLFL